MNTVLLYNRVAVLPFGDTKDVLADEDTIRTAQDVGRALARLGHRVDKFEVSARNLREIPKLPADLFFNLAEGVGEIPGSEYRVIAQLEKTGRPFTGSGSDTLRLTTDKARTKRLLRKHRLPTPEFQVFKLTGPLALSNKLHPPLVIKPADKDGSLGINGHSVLVDSAEIIDQADYLRDVYQDKVLAEEYIDGREINLTVLGSGPRARVLPISEIVFGTSFAGKYKMVDFAAKWEEDSLAFRETVGVCPARLTTGQARALSQLALAAVKFTGCRNYSRVDFRLDPQGRAFILEVNANPGIARDSGVVRSARAAGLSFDDLIAEIVSLTLAGR